MINPYCFTDRALEVGSNISFHSHHINYSNSKLTIWPDFPAFGIEPWYINKILKDMHVDYARLKNQ